jgi:hypothetical protein
MAHIPAPQEDGETWKSTITATTSGNLTSVEYNGVDYDITDTDATDEAAVRAVIEALVTGDSVPDAEKEHLPLIEVSYSTGDLTITHYGQGKINSVLLSDVGGGSTDQAFTITEVERGEH